MATHEEMQRKELDPFQPLERAADRPPDRREELEPTAATTLRPAELAQQQLLKSLVDSGHKTEAEAPAPHMVAELPQQGEVNSDSMKRLFEHYTEPDSDDEVVETKAETPVDSRYNRQRPLLQRIDAGDVIQDGIEGDFVADSAIVGADLDTHPHQASGDDVDGWGDRRRRAAESPWAPGDPPETEPTTPATAVAAPTTTQEST